MAGVVKVLGQIVPAATTLTTLYTCASLKGATVSTLTITNRGNTSATFRVSIAVANAANDTKQYLYYDLLISAHETFASTIGISLANTDVIRVYASNVNLTFQAFGIELS